MHIRNMLFSLMLCLLISAPAAIFCIDSVVEGTLPGWLTGEDATYLSGGERKPAGSTRGRIESAIDDNIPCKAFALLETAALQRTFIASSNFFFDWSCYPTHYGSSVVYVPDHDALSYIPNSESPNWVEPIEAFSSALSCYAREHPDVNFYVVIPDEIDSSEGNPVGKLISNAVYTKDFLDAMQRNCADEENVFVDGKLNQSFDECLSEFYATDAHWNGYGALASFNRFTRKGLPEYTPLGNIHIDDGSFYFNGGGSRTGLMLLHKEVNEPALAISDFVIDEGPEADLLSQDSKSVIPDLYNEYNFYSAWYGGYGSLRSTALDSSEWGSALVVSDSFGYPFRWIVAAIYLNTYGVMDLYSSSKEDVSLEERIGSSGANTVFFVGSPHDFSTFLDRHPRYFDSAFIAE